MPTLSKLLWIVAVSLLLVAKFLPASGAFVVVAVSLAALSSLNILTVRLRPWFTRRRLGLYKTHIKAGRELMSKGLLTPALARFEAAIEEDTTLADGYGGKAAVLAEMSQFEQAIEN